ncbi:MAG: hypothetical protein ATN31_11120 [Candidatus Epulonipiscioides saccharophilum]|nr:MAG: hypothetical protein ATN31_11120 [Epulopiscium sp. AS2M-Bin001]
MKKSTFILAWLILMTGCSFENTKINSDVAQTKTDIIEQTQVVEQPIEPVVEQEIELEQKSEKVEIIKEERTIPMEIHVYSNEIPWDISVEIPMDATTSINEAMKAAIPGDTIIVHEGIYRETLNISKDNITIIANENDYVLVSGNAVVTDFVPCEEIPGVYVADVPENYKLDFTQVFANGEYQNIARYPNLTLNDMMEPLEPGGGYEELDSIFKPKDSLEVQANFQTDAFEQLDLTGGIYRGLVGKNRHYVIGDIISNDSNSVKFKSVSTNDWSKTGEVTQNYHPISFGFVMHKNLIDIPGEWYVEDRKIYYMPKGDITDLQIEMQVRPKVLLLNNREYVTIKNINFIAGNAQMKNSNNISIDNCTMRYLQPFYKIKGYSIGESKETGFYMENSSNNKFNNFYLAHGWGNGVYISGGEDNLFTNSVFKDLGWIGTFTAGLYTSGENNFVRDCTFEHNGRFQIRVDKDVKIDILHSKFVNAMELGEDAGALQFTSTGKIGPLDLKGSRLAYNIVSDLEGIPVFAGNYKKRYVCAFYMEDVNNYTAHHNLVYNLNPGDYGSEYEFEKVGGVLYIGPRYNAMDEPVNYYNNTSWNCTRSLNAWGIEISNIEELNTKGVTQKENSGTMTNGHFANNIFNESLFRLIYSTQNLTEKGGSTGWADNDHNNWKPILTPSMEEYFEHMEKVGYVYNPQTNMMLKNDTGAENYINVETGDFRLTENSLAKGAGTPIPGITASDTPDLGALEGSDYVLSAGANLELPKFKEIR